MFRQDQSSGAADLFLPPTIPLDTLSVTAFSSHITTH